MPGAVVGANFHKATQASKSRTGSYPMSTVASTHENSRAGGPRLGARMEAKNKQELFTRPEVRAQPPGLGDNEGHKGDIWVLATVSTP